MGRKTPARQGPPIPREAVHLFHASGKRDPWKRRICVCGSIEQARLHRVVEVDEETKAVGQQIIGEGNE